jgi:hypothetical protein
MYGQTSYFISRKPTDKELDECQHHYITSYKEWDPMSDHFAEAEINVPRYSLKIWRDDGGLQLKLQESRWKKQLPNVMFTMTWGPLKVGLKHSNSSCITISLQQSSTVFQESLPSKATLMQSCSTLQMVMLRFTHET